MDITAPAPASAPTTPSKTADPKCAKLRRELKHQKQHLARAGTDKKRRLQRLGCTS